MGEVSMRNTLLIIFGTLVTGFQSLFIFAVALGSTGSKSWLGITFLQMAMSAGLGVLLAVLWDHRKTIDKIWIILIPPGGLMALMVQGMIQASSRGSTSVSSELPFLLIPLAIGLPAIFIPMLAAKYKHEEDNSNSQEKRPLSYFESKILAENSRQTGGLNEDKSKTQESTNDIKDKSS
jgi:hypothetical protein